MLRRNVQAVDVEAVDVDSPAISSPEVSARPTRRRFTAAYKARILEAAERCKEAGEVGALLRREGLYASHLVSWRRQRAAEGEAGLSRKRGRKTDPDQGTARRIAQLERANERLAERLRKAEFIIEFQKKMAILWATPSTGESEGHS
jgi:transposase-like protein